MIAIMQPDFFSFLENIPHRPLRFNSGAMVVDMDDKVTSLLVVKSGMVHLVRFQENGDMVVLQRAGAGAILAEASVFSDSYHCSAVAVRNVELNAYPLKAVLALFSRAPEATQAYALHLAREVRSARKRAEILALKTVSERLSAWLTWSHGLLPERGAWHHVADEIGISKEALYRELSKRRKREGLVCD